MTEKQMRIEQMKALGRYSKQLAKEKKNLTKEHAEYLERDIIEIYSAMAVVLFNNGNSVESIHDLIMQISHEWNYHVTESNRNMTMADYCKQLTGIDLREDVS